MRAIVIDDFKLARLELISLISKHKDIIVVGEGASSDDALLLIEKHKPDVVFTDINMPGRSIFDFLDNIDNAIQIVFTTAHSDYALKSFAYNTTDYLLKPISQERFDVAALKLKSQYGTHKKSQENARLLAEDSSTMIKLNNDFILKNIADICYLESTEEDTSIVFIDSMTKINKSLSKIEKQLPEHIFFRISRQCVVNIRHVRAILETTNGSGQEVELANGSKLPITRRQFTKIRDSLLL